MPTTLAQVMKGLSPAERAEVERGARDILLQHRTLSELRKALNVTQSDLAEALETSQANIAQIESKKDVMVSTVARVVEALGGRLQMVVTLPGQAAVVLQIGRTKSGPAVKKVASRKPRTGTVAYPTSAGEPERRKRE